MVMLAIVLVFALTMMLMVMFALVVVFVLIRGQCGVSIVVCFGVGAKIHV